jgi:hypothetical protein
MIFYTISALISQFEEFFCRCGDLAFMFGKEIWFLQSVNLLIKNSITLFVRMSTNMITVTVQLKRKPNNRTTPGGAALGA